MDHYNGPRPKLTRADDLGRNCASPWPSHCTLVLSTRSYDSHSYSSVFTLG